MNDMVDMSNFVEAKSDQLNSDDLIGAPRTITVTRVTGADGDQPVSIFYQGDNGKPFKPCKTIRRILMAIWGKYANEYVGRSMTLYRDDSVTFGGLATGGIRISHMSHLDKETVVVVMKTKGKKAGIKILPLQMQQSAALTVDQATDRLRAAFDLDELRTIWSAKVMAPFRDQLGDVLAEMKTSLTAAADQNAGHGENHSFDADQIIAFIDAKVRAEDVMALVASHADTIATFDEADVLRIETAKQARLAAIRGEG